MFMDAGRRVSVLWLSCLPKVANTSFSRLYCNHNQAMLVLPGIFIEKHKQYQRVLAFICGRLQVFNLKSRSC